MINLFDVVISVICPKKRCRRIYVEHIYTMEIKKRCYEIDLNKGNNKNLKYKQWKLNPSSCDSHKFHLF